MSHDSPRTPVPEKPPFFRQAIVLWAAGVLGTVALMPYAMDLLREQFEKAATKLGISTSAVAAIAVIQAAVYLAVAVGVGLWPPARPACGRR